MRKSICFVAVAGSGKTTHLVEMGRERLIELEKVKGYHGKLAYVTFTTNNKDNLQNRLCRRIGFSDSIVVLGWYQFLLSTFIQPYKRDMIERLYTTQVSVSFANPPTYKDSNGKNRPAYKKGELEKKFLDKDSNIYKDYIAEFALECIQKNEVTLQKYLPSIFDTIYIDEAQDLCGYDFEILKFLVKKVNVPIIVAGDAKQTTYTTANTRKNHHITFDSYLSEKVNTKRKEYITINRTTLIYTHRCISAISAIASKVSPMPLTRTCSCDECEEKRKQYIHRLRGAYLVKKIYIQAFLEETKSAILRWDKTNRETEGMTNVYNMGEVKGLEFDPVLVFPTGNMLEILQGNGVPRSEIVHAKLYVAVTRPRYILGVIVPDGFNAIIDGFSWYIP